MYEQHKYKLIFQTKLQQKKFLAEVRTSLRCSWVDLAQLTHVHPRTLNGWKNGQHSMSLRAAKLLSKKSHVSLPNNIIVLDWHNHLKQIGRIGGAAIIKKYGHVGGDDVYRKIKWKQWWEKEGEAKLKNVIGKRKSFFRPRRSTALAEFIGIMLGDGGISKLQFTITLHRYDDREFLLIVKKMIQDLFHITPSTYQHIGCLADSLVVSRVALTDYLVNELDLVRGNKIRQQMDIPFWIKNDQRYYVACVRGLVDTDGCVIKHAYKVNGKKYMYKKIGFTTHSSRLRESVYALLNDLDIKSRLAGKYDIRIESQKDVVKYFDIIGFHNPKHLKRYLE